MSLHERDSGGPDAAPPGATTTGAPRSATPGGSRILLVEDEPNHAEIVSAVLGIGGYRVVVAKDGAEGLARVREERPDLVLLDVKMPGVDGVTAAERLRADAATRSIPILFLTACDSVEPRLRRLEPAAGYLAKPFHARELLARVECLLDQPVARALLEDPAFLDGPTGLGNACFLSRRLAAEGERAARHGTAVGLVLLDVDGLSRWNRRRGRAAGDALLGTLGRVLREEILDGDAAARTGEDDELAVLLPQATVDEARRFAERLLERWRGGRPEGAPGISLGVVARRAVTGPTAGQLLLDAGFALARAKARGGDAVEVFRGGAGVAQPSAGAGGAAGV